MVSAARTLVTRQGVLLRRADPRHIRMTVEVATAFRAPAFPREGFERFFRERCLWPDGGSRPLNGGGR